MVEGVFFLKSGLPREHAVVEELVTSNRRRRTLTPNGTANAEKSGKG